MLSLHRNSRLFNKTIALSVAAGLALVVPSMQAQEGAKFTLDTVLRMAVENNYDIKIEEINPLIAQDAVSAAWGEFDPIYFMEYQRQFNQKVQNALDLANNGTPNFYFENDDQHFRSGIGIKSPIGTEFQAFTSVDVLDNTRNRTGPGGGFDLTKQRLDNIFSPEYETFAGLQLNQPLLQGLGFGWNLKTVREARLNIGISEYGRQVVIINTMLEVISAFYDLGFAQTDLQVKRDSVSIAESLVKENRRRQNVGLMAPLEVMEAEVRVSEAFEEVVKSEDFIRDRRVKLLQLINTRYDDITAPDISVEAEFGTEVPTFDFASLRSSAFVNRPDYLLAQRNVDKEQLTVDYQENKKLPQLDLSLAYGLNGFGSSIDNSYDLLAQAERPRWSAGISLKMPIPGRTATYEKIASLRKRSQAELKVRQMELRIPLEIQNTLGRVSGLHERLRFSRDAIKLAEEASKLEFARLEQGKTTTRNALEIQDRLSEARTRELAARAEMKKAVAEVWATSGLLLQKLGYDLQPDLAVRKSFNKLNETPSIAPTPPQLLPANQEPTPPKSSGFFPYIIFGHRPQR